MWKDFFSFSKRERITIVALTAFILVVQVLIWTKDAWVKYLPVDLERRYVEKKALDAYRDSVMSAKPTYAVGSRTNTQERKSAPLRLVPFNPNTADSTTLRGLGLRSYVVKNILNYRRKGGKFREPSDLDRIYGMDPAVLATLKPLIVLETALTEGQSTAPKGETSVNQVLKSVVARTTSQTTVLKSETPSVTQVVKQENISSETAPQTFELNTADTALLLQLKGIGSYTANRIARYRNQLGGFYSASQLSEIKGLYPETLARLQSMTKIDPAHINRLDVNKASLEKLRSHPYLSFYQAKVIVELRKSRGKLRSIEELIGFKEFTPEDLEKLKWYLSF